MENQKIRQGEIYYANIPITSCALAGFRPVVVLSSNYKCDCSNVILVAPITGRIKRADICTNVVVKLDKPSTIICNNIACVEKDELGEYMGRLTQAEFKQVQVALLTEFGFIA